MTGDRGHRRRARVALNRAHVSQCSQAPRSSVGRSPQKRSPSFATGEMSAAPGSPILHTCALPQPGRRSRCANSVHTHHAATRAANPGRRNRRRGGSREAPCDREDRAGSAGPGAAAWQPMIDGMPYQLRHPSLWFGRKRTSTSGRLWKASLVPDSGRAIPRILKRPGVYRLQRPAFCKNESAVHCSRRAAPSVARSAPRPSETCQPRDRSDHERGAWRRAAARAGALIGGSDAIA